MENIPCGVFCPVAENGVCDKDFGSKECLDAVSRVKEQLDYMIKFACEDDNRGCNEGISTRDKWVRHYRWAGEACLNALGRAAEHVEGGRATQSQESVDTVA